VSECGISAGTDGSRAIRHVTALADRFEQGLALLLRERGGSAHRDAAVAGVCSPRAGEDSDSQGSDGADRHYTHDDCAGGTRTDDECAHFK